MKALLALQWRILVRTTIGSRWSGVSVAVLLTLLMVPYLLLNRPPMMPLVPVLLLLAIPWVLFATHVLQVMEVAAAALPMARSRILLAHLLQTGTAWALVALCVAPLLRSAHPGEEEGTVLLQLLLLVLTVTWTPALAQSAYARGSIVLWLLAAVLYFGPAVWMEFLFPLRILGASDVPIPAPGIPALRAQAALPVLLGTLFYLRSGDRGGVGSRSGSGLEGTGRPGKVIVGRAIPGGRSLPVCLHLSASTLSLALFIVIWGTWFSFRAREASADAFILGQLVLLTGFSHYGVLRGWRLWISLPVNRSRAFRILMIPSLALLLFGAGLRAFLVQGEDRVRTFPVAGFRGGVGSNVDVPGVGRQGGSGDPRAKGGGFFERAVSMRMEATFGYRPEPARLRAAIQEAVGAASLADDRWQQGKRGEAAINDAYERIMVAFSPETRWALLIRSLADTTALLLVGALLLRLVLLHWKRYGHRHVALGAVAVGFMLVIFPDADLTGGMALALRDGYYAAYQALPTLCTLVVLVAAWMVVRSCSRAFCRLEWDMLPEPAAGGLET